MTEQEATLEPIFEVPGLPHVRLPTDLEARYGGPFGLAEEIVYANFVTSIDGVAAIASERRSSSLISGGAPADRFVMALLRGMADAVVIGSGTLVEHDGPWTGEKAFPDAAEAIGILRSELAIEAAPRLVVMTGSGNLPVDHPSLPDAIVITTTKGAGALERNGVACREVLLAGEGASVDPVRAVRLLRERRHGRILVEGGPKLMGAMLAASAVEELFLTISPRLLGGGEDLSPLADGVDLREAGPPGAQVLSVRRAGSYLFLRYAIGS